MNAPEFTQDNLLFTVHSPLGENKLLFKNLQGEEQLSGLFHFQLELLSESRGIDFQEILGQALTLRRTILVILTASLPALPKPILIAALPPTTPIFAPSSGNLLSLKTVAFSKIYRFPTSLEKSLPI
ncbi:MAG: hypothetical protein HC877_16210 [Thioploca sp.]|nr:hypothetical protein [Thioploca sp.]